MTIRPTHPDGTPLTVKEYFSRKNARKEKRKEKKTVYIRQASSKKVLKDKIVRLLGLLDCHKYGAWCRLDRECPQAWRGLHLGTTAYHLVPQSRGDSTRFLPDNVVWTCAQANLGEYRNRSLYRAKHVEIFGAERIERLEEIAGGEPVHFTMADLWNLHDKIKAELERNP